MTEERAIYQTEVEDELKKELKYARWLIGEQAEKIRELESDLFEMKYKHRNLYQLLHGREMVDDHRE